LDINPSEATAKAPRPDSTRRRAKRSAIVGLSLALFCVVFTIIYEHFSHNAASDHMRCMFLMPLCGVGLPGLIGYFTPLHRYVDRAAFNLWNSAMAVWAVGCLFRGIVNISGRHTTLDQPYWIAGWVFIVLALAAEIIHLIHRKSFEKGVS
jgi:hypothetical protein